ncbi:hypothetical protein [Vulcanisaeta sp. JCM 16161]|uniref:hypothetical protein n=1 Tax=Vulcanisaeta sp. JCM 16161 TaxID=1295372 RepID=UPI001FB3F0AD|nr:hypothetical protein [Vulcanisaeta sp. JCM 16161]
MYLHLKPNEHFGIAVLDAIATATIPIVPRTGGPWTDIVEEGKYGLGYTNIEEIPQLISKAENTLDREKNIQEQGKIQPRKLQKKTHEGIVNGDSQ